MQFTIVLGRPKIELATPSALPSAPKSVDFLLRSTKRKLQPSTTLMAFDSAAA